MSKDVEINQTGIAMEDVTVALLEDLIKQERIVLWIHYSDGSSALVSATSVCMNGNAVQIEADPEWKFGHAD